MNKDFEQAYREMAQNEAPDLWDRIEAGLSEKSAPVLSVEQTKEAVDPQEQKKIAVLLPYRKYITLAAALLCVVILIPVAGMIFRSSGGSSSSGTSALDNGAGASAADTSVAKEAPEAEESTSETAAGTLGVADTASPTQNNAAPYAQLPQKEEAAAAPAEIKEAENTLDAMDGGMAESGMLESSAESRVEEEVSASEKVMSDLERLKEDEVISHVMIRVQEAEYTRDAGDIDEAGTLYTFIVEKETSGVLSAGEVYVLFVPAYSSYAFIEDEVYEVDLSYREGEKYSFVLKGYYG